VKYIIIVILALMSLNLMAEDAVKEEVKPQVVKLDVVADTLIATITIPPKMHMTKQEDFVYVDIEDLEGVKLGKTIWSDGAHLDELGALSYEKQAVLKRSIIRDKSLMGAPLKIKVYVGYQMCFDSYCEPPEEVEIELIVPPVHCGRCPGKK